MAQRGDISYHSAMHLDADVAREGLFSLDAELYETVQARRSLPERARVLSGRRTASSS
jgi:hypothetical protein